MKDFSKSLMVLSILTVPFVSCIVIYLAWSKEENLPVISSDPVPGIELSGCLGQVDPSHKIVTRNEKVRKLLFKSEKKKPVLVAVIDTGVEIEHPALKDSIWTNPGESGLDSLGRDKASNGIDDDGNGYIDDVHGWNFVDNDNDISDNHGHGTHVAGIIRTMSEDGSAPSVQIMVLKYYSEPKGTNSFDPQDSTIKAIEYAVKMNAKIINYSGGGRDPSDEEFRAVKKAAYSGILFVAAAGNNGEDSDIDDYYPADYHLSNIISVAAINSRMQILGSSNYGKETVDILAPGENIESYFPGKSSGCMSGTSQAAAMVTGTASLLLSLSPQTLPLDIKPALVSTVTRVRGLETKSKSQGVIDLEKAALLIKKMETRNPTSIN